MKGATRAVSPRAITRFRLPNACGNACVVSNVGSAGNARHGASESVQLRTNSPSSAFSRAGRVNAPQPSRLAAGRPLQTRPLVVSHGRTFEEMLDLLCPEILELPKSLELQLLPHHCRRHSPTPVATIAAFFVHCASSPSSPLACIAF